MPSTVARSSARDSEPWRGEMNNSPKPCSSATEATPSANRAKNGLAKTWPRAWGVRMPMVVV